MHISVDPRALVDATAVVSCQCRMASISPISTVVTWRKLVTSESRLSLMRVHMGSVRGHCSRLAPVRLVLGQLIVGVTEELRFAILLLSVCLLEVCVSSNAGEDLTVSNRVRSCGSYLKIGGPIQINHVLGMRSKILKLARNSLTFVHFESFHKLGSLEKEFEKEE